MAFTELTTKFGASLSRRLSNGSLCLPDIIGNAAGFGTGLCMSSEGDRKCAVRDGMLKVLN
eukprot:3148687-Alexandrium_andersonii.AAC.1